MFLLLDRCRDPDSGQILTTPNALPLSHLSEHANGKWRSKVNWERSFCLHLWSLLHITIRNISVHLLRIFRRGAQLSFSRIRSRFKSSHHYDRRFDSHCHNGILVIVSFCLFDWFIFSGRGMTFQELTCFQDLILMMLNFLIRL